MEVFSSLNLLDDLDTYKSLALVSWTTNAIAKEVIKDTFNRIYDVKYQSTYIMYQIHKILLCKDVLTPGPGNLRVLGKNNL